MYSLHDKYTCAVTHWHFDDCNVVIFMSASFHFKPLIRN